MSFRFLCEVAMLVAYWGFHDFEGAGAYPAGIGAPLAAVVVWGAAVVFAVVALSTSWLIAWKQTR